MLLAAYLGCAARPQAVELGPAGAVVGAKLSWTYAGGSVAVELGRGGRCWGEIELENCRGGSEAVELGRWGRMD